MNTNKICFLIDDDLDDQGIFLDALKQTEKPVECHIAHNGVEALDRLTTDASFIPHYIFLDYQMPKMDGKECLKEIKKLEHLHRVPVFMYTSASEEFIGNELKQLGAEEFIPKSSSFSSIVAALSDVLTKHDKRYS